MQLINTHIEAKLLSEFYDARFRLFSNDKDDLLESKRQYERALGLIKDISKEQKELFEILGLIQTCFKMNDEIESAVDAIYNVKTLDVQSFRGSYKNADELLVEFQIESKKINPTIKQEYQEKIDTLVTLIKKQVIKS